MKNTLANFMKEQKEKVVIQSIESSEKLQYFFIVNSELDLLQDNTNEEEVEKLGNRIDCFNLGLDDICGKSQNCEACGIANVIRESFENKEDVLKKSVTVDVKYGKYKEKRYYYVSSFVNHNNEDVRYLIIDDVSNDIIKSKLNELELHIRTNIDMLNLDDIAKLILDRIEEVVKSELAILYVLKPEVGFFEPYYLSRSVNLDKPIRDVEDIIDRRLWLRCVSGKEVIINNNYEISLKKKALSSSNLDIRRVMLAPIVFNDQVVAVLILANKAKAYNRFDLSMIEGFMDNVIQVVKKKLAYDALFSERLKHLNLVDTIDVGIIRYISSNKGQLKVDYANSATTDIFGLETGSIVAQTDCFIPFLENEELKDFLAAREKSLVERSPFKWLGVMKVNGSSRYIRFHIVPGHLDDRGFNWEGTIMDMTEQVKKLLEMQDKIHNKTS